MRRPFAIVLLPLLLNVVALGSFFLYMGHRQVTNRQPLKTVSATEQPQPFADSEGTPLFDVPKLDKIAIDGGGDDWSGRGLVIDTLANLSGKVQSKDDIDANVRLGWTDRGLMALITVHDDVPLEDGNPINGDSVELFLANKVGSTELVRFAIGPGVDPAMPKLRTRAYDLRRDPALRKTQPKISAARQKLSTGGYVIETLIPWNNLGLTKPKVGQEVAFQLIVNDADGSSGTSRLAWFPSARVTKGDTSKMHRLRLGGPAQPETDVRFAAVGTYPRFHSTRVTITTTDASLAGRAINLCKMVDGEHNMIASAKLEHDFVRPELLSAIVTLPMAQRGGGGYGTLDLCLDGKRLPAVVDLPDPGRMAQWLMPYESFVFKPCVFSSRAFPDGDFEDPTYVEDLVGAYETKVTYYDANFNVVTTADRPGRYGAVVEVRPEEQPEKTYKYFCTLFREPKDFSWRNAEMPVTVNLPKEMGISAAALKKQQRSVSRYFKDLMSDDGLNRDNETAVLLAGLYETRETAITSADQGTAVASVAAGAATAVNAELASSSEGSAAAMRNSPESMDRRWWATLKQKINEPVISHLTVLPADYDKDPNRRWPVLLFLHGKGERGDDLSQLRSTPLLGRLEYDEAFRKNFPFIVVAPQCREGDWWSSHELARLLDDVEKAYRVDTDREYVTGMSMGGYGTWAIANEFPDRFAAIAPVCGGGDADEAARLARVPVWTFHGARDSIVPFWESDRMVKALQALGDEVKFTVYPDAGHDAWSETYANPELYAWLLKHSRSANQRSAQLTTANVRTVAAAQAAPSTQPAR